MKKIIWITTFLIACFSLNAQSQISGKIQDKKTGETIIGATVVIEGTSNGQVTDMDGNFTLEVAPGTYNLVISYVSYQTSKVLVIVKANEITNINVILEEAKTEMKEVVIVAKAERSSSVALMIERKKASQVSDGISADLIRKTPDRTTSDVLKRVTGASIQDNKFVIIRGMNDRYNAGYLDGALLPSTESDRKAFSFDIVPANLLDNLTIYKSGTPDLMGDFGGGIIKINTKAIPERLAQNLLVGGQMHSLTTFNDFFQYKRYTEESFNLTSKERNIPIFDEGGLKINSVFPNAEDKSRLADISSKFNNDWSNTNVSATPNSRFSYSIGMPIQLGNDRKLGLVFALNYANTRRISLGNINSYDGAGQTSSFNDKSYFQNINSGGLLNINYVSTNTQLNFRNLLNYNTDNNTIQRTGIGNIQDALTVQNSANLINHNRLYNGIISLKQMIGDNYCTLNTSINYSNINRQVPDYRIVSYTKSPDFDEYRLSLGDFFNSSTGRFASNLKEDIKGGTVELTKSINTKSINTDIKIGFLNQTRNREFWGRSFVYSGNPSTNTMDPAQDLGATSIGNNKLFLIEKTSNDLAYYTGNSNLNAAYVMADQKFSDKLTTVYGVRMEHINLSVDNNKVNTSIANINETSWLPSINATYALNENINIRADYFASLNRPEFRELAPFAFYVFDKNAEIRGNRDLKIAKLDNYDLRFELFPSGNQIISVGGFYKNITNPIEQSIDITQTSTTFTYDNQKSAKIYGLEFEIRKGLDFIGLSIFKNFTVYSNLSLMSSKLTFEDGSQSLQDRPLQGQSPYILNLGLQFDDKVNGWFGSIGLNKFGRRIAYVGVDPKFGETRQDIYENPRTVLDMQVGKNIKRFNLKFTIGDLFHNDLVFYQDANLDKKYDTTSSDRLIFKYNNGFTSTLSLGFSF